MGARQVTLFILGVRVDDDNSIRNNIYRPFPKREFRYAVGTINAHMEITSIDEVLKYISIDNQFRGGND